MSLLSGIADSKEEKSSGRKPKHMGFAADQPPMPHGVRRKSRQAQPAPSTTTPNNALRPFDPISGSYVTEIATTAPKPQRAGPPGQPPRRAPHSTSRKKESGMASWIGDESSHARFRKIKRIGSGANGETYLAKDTTDGKSVVAKVLNTKDMDNRDLRYAFSEIRCLTSLQHPFIIGHKADHYDTNALLIVTEYAEGGDLEQVIAHQGEGDGFFTENHAMFIFLQLCSAVHTIHAARMLHRDIKSANVFLTANGVVKLGDFGYSQSYYGTISDKVAETFCGTPCYLSPEVWEGSKYSKKADAWSLGVVLYELLFLQKPFASSNINDLRFSVIHEEASYHSATSYSPQLMNLAKGLLKKNPDERSSTRAVFAEKYVKDVIVEFKKAINRTSEKRLSAAEKQSIIAGVTNCLDLAVTPPSGPAGQPETVPDAEEFSEGGKAVHFCPHGPTVAEQNAQGGEKVEEVPVLGEGASLLSGELIPLELASASLSGDTTWGPCTIVFKGSEFVVESEGEAAQTIGVGDITNACPLPGAVCGVVLQNSFCNKIWAGGSRFFRTFSAPPHSATRIGCQ